MFPNQDPNAFLLQSVATEGEGNDFAERFLEGEHLIALNVFEIKDTQDHGKIISVDFVVLQSSVQGYAGKPAGEGFFIQKSDKEGGKASRQRAFALAKAVVQSLGGNPDDPEYVINPQTGQPVVMANGQPLTKGQAIVNNTLAEMARADQPWRGVVLRASGRKRTGKTSKKEYIAVKYAPVTQTMQQIAEARARILAATPAPAPQTMAPVTGMPPAAMPAGMTAPAIAGYAPAAPAPAPVQYQQQQTVAAAPVAPPVQYQQTPAPVAPAPAPAAAPVAAPAFTGPSLLG